MQVPWVDTKAGDVSWRGYGACSRGTRRGILVIGVDGVIQLVNPAATQIFGYEACEMIGRNVSMLMPEPDRNAHEGYIKTYLGSGEARIINSERNVEGHRKGGSLFPLVLKVSEIWCGGERWFVGYTWDVTERGKMDARLEKMHRDRLSSIGELAAGLAHELNQPLAAGSYLNVARRLARLPPEKRPSSLEDALDKGAAQLVRAGHIVTHLREFIARREPNKILTDLHKLIEETLELVRPGTEQRHIRLSVQLAAPKSSVIADRVQLKQVLVNLIRNAKESMLEGERRELTISTWLSSQQTIRVDVADTGAGLAEIVKADLFEPFMTTKKGGLGVGLSISREIIEAHYGKIWAEANPSGGTTMSFTVPLVEG